MSSQGNGRPLRYDVRCSEKIKATIKQLHQQASEQGKGQQFLDSLRTILDRLQEDPDRLGEPLYRLPALKLLVYQVIVSRVVVDYAVHEEKLLVFLKGVKLLD